MLRIDRRDLRSPAGISPDTVRRHAGQAIRSVFPDGKAFAKNCGIFVRLPEKQYLELQNGGKEKMKKKKTLDRDLSWVYFNHRILQEARRENVPLLERLSFLGIYSNNLDEFFRVRVSAMKRIAEYGSASSGSSRTGALACLRTINRLTYGYSLEFDRTFAELKEKLAHERIFIIDERQLSEAQTRYIRMVYRNDLNSATYPLIMTQGAQLGEPTDSSIYLAVAMTYRRTDGGIPERDFALIELPVRDFGRFVVLPSEDDSTYIIFLDDVVRFCLPFIFSGLGYDSFEAYTLKFTRDAELELDSDIDEGLVEKVARGVRNRRKGEPVRFVYDRNMPEDMLRYFKRKFDIDRYDSCVDGSRYHNMKDLIHFPDCGRSDLKFSRHAPVPAPGFDTLESTLENIRRKDRFLHYPYHSFSNYIRVLREAALSRDVTSIKTTVYRLARNSHVVKALICAARHGKKVTVMVELMARFDEASNINWSKKMQDAGIQVLFGVEGLKVHGKLTHIASPQGDIACVSTGNFHEGNARSYTDITVFTADPSITRDVDRVFSFIQYPYRPAAFDRLIVSPLAMRRRLYSLLADEIRHAKKGEDAYVMGKINHITDERLIGKLYEAAAAGVKLRLLVRGNCSLTAENTAGEGEPIRIRGIIDRYLEHSRILIFRNGGDERYFIGSADWMTRNIDRRIEVYVPVSDPTIRTELRRIVEYGLRDNVAARIVDGSGRNEIFRDGKPEFRSQEKLYEYYSSSDGKP